LVAPHIYLKMQQLFNKNKLSLLIILFTIISPLVFSSLFTLLISQNINYILNFSTQQWVLYFIISAFTMALALTPTTFVAILTGYLLGWIGIVGLIPAYLFASYIGFEIGKYTDRGSLLEYFKSKPKVAEIILLLKKEEFWIIVFSRLSPALPFAMMNIFLAFMNTNRKYFYLGSLLGMLPRTLFSVWVGIKSKDVIQIFTGKEEMKSHEFFLLLLLIASIIGMYVIYKKALLAYKNKMKSEL